MLFPYMRGYTPLRIGKRQVTVNHQTALSSFALFVVLVLCWHLFGPEVAQRSTAAFTALSREGSKVLPLNWSVTLKGAQEGQGTVDWARPAELRRIVGIVFYGRPASVSILDCYLKRNLVANGGMLDEVIFLARTEDEDALAWLDQLVMGEPGYSRHDVKTYGKSYASAYDICEDDIMYIKIDDDIVFFEDSTIPTLVRTRWEHPEYYVVAANVVNQPSLSWVHHQLGVIKPYWPEYTPEMQRALDEDVLLKNQKAKEEAEKAEEERKGREEAEKAKEAKKADREKKKADRELNKATEAQKRQTSHHALAVKRDEQTMDDAAPTTPTDTIPSETTPTISPSNTPLFKSIYTNWRPSLLPKWSGPDNFTLPDDFTPSVVPRHRWLPLGDDSMLEQTAIMATEYGAFTPALFRWTIATQMHYSFLEHLERNELWRYKFYKWDYYYKRLGIQFIAIMGRDINMAKPLEQDDESYFSEVMPRKLKRHAIVDGRAIAAHYSFEPQSKGMVNTDVLDRYRSFAEENICAERRPQR